MVINQPDGVFGSNHSKPWILDDPSDHPTKILNRNYVACWWFIPPIYSDFGGGLLLF